MSFCCWLACYRQAHCLDSQPVVQAIEQLAAAEECDLVIISDANSVFITEILRHHSLLDCFQQACMSSSQATITGL